MKKLTLFSVLLILISFSVQAQKMNAIKTNLFSPIIRTGHILYERVINENMSFQLGFFYTGYTDRDTDASLKGWGITPEYRYYLTEETPAPAGLYLAPSFRYQTFTVTDPVLDETGTLTSFGIALNFGKQMLLKEVILIDVFVGPAYNIRNLEAPDDIDSPIQGANGFGFRIGLVIGVAF